MPDRPKRVAAIHDLSGFGRCSLSVILPTLSVMGVQCAVLPTAYLSTHTAFPDFTFLDLTEEMKKTMDHWQTLGLSFRLHPAVPGALPAAGTGI